MGPNQTNSRRTNRQHTERSSDSGGRSEQRGGGSVPDPPRRGKETRREGSGSEVCGAPCACSAMYAMEEGRRGTASVSFICAATVVNCHSRKKRLGGQSQKVQAKTIQNDRRFFAYVQTVLGKVITIMANLVTRDHGGIGGD
jgi:hypothetical protein